MKLILAFGLLSFALAFCGITERLQNLTQSNSNTATTSNSAVQGGGDKNITFEKPEPSGAQQALINGGKEIKWDEQGMTWRVPQGWRQLSKDRNSFNWMGADNAALLVNIAPMAENFPADVSVKAYYDGKVSEMKNGEIEKVRYLEIDGVKGVEFIESKKDGSDDARRHQWIGYRKYAGQLQMLNLMVAVKEGAFEKHREEFAAVLYSTKIIDQK